ncbi:hypothetical protein JOF56_003618 [Kibdelosporangium banguiense]|uniref:DUF4352 domain-containing protein n=1 Tax=Kibdelosporangium banguiense TaxID=1365924 RepID=A0ABS4TFN4_9PSEU|nr:hypothetical protein [Kibdelosporangium banguiense]MBP2323233.1 hypothetical protein [Kibdelosporangium banguiense]
MRFAALITLVVLVLSACTPKPGTVSDSSGSAKSAAPAENPTWGKRFTWPDGVAIEVAAPAACKPGEFSLPEDIKRAAKFKVLVVNDSKKPFEAGMLAIGSDGQFAGAKAEKVTDVDGPCKDTGLDTATVLPGKTYSFEIAFAVGAEPGEMQLTFQPDFTSAKAIYVGQV